MQIHGEATENMKFAEIQRRVGKKALEEETYRQARRVASTLFSSLRDAMEWPEWLANLYCPTGGDSFTLGAVFHTDDGTEAIVPIQITADDAGRFSVEIGRSESIHIWRDDPESSIIEEAERPLRSAELDVAGQFGVA